MQPTLVSNYSFKEKECRLWEKAKREAFFRLRKGIGAFLCDPTVALATVSLVGRCWSLTYIISSNLPLFYKTNFSDHFAFEASLHLSYHSLHKSLAKAEPAKLNSSAKSSGFPHPHNMNMWTERKAAFPSSNCCCPWDLIYIMILWKEVLDLHHQNASFG